jgi:mono/diheme cytochrome c family protein
LLALTLAVGATGPAAAQTPSAPQGSAASGAKLYVDRACWQCHGLAAQGGGIAGPRLAGRVQVWAAFSAYVRRPAEEMIPYTAKVLPDRELADIFEWLRSLPPPPAVDSLAVLSPQR